MNAKQRYNAKRAAKHRSERREEIELAKAIGTAMCGSQRVHKALSSTDYKMSMRQPKESATTGSICMPDVAIYHAGNRTVRKEAVHIIK